MTTTNASPDTAKAAAVETGELIRTTGERVETGFWSTINEVLLNVPNIIAFLLVVAAAWLVGRVLGRWLGRRLTRQGKTDLGRLLGSCLTGLVVFVCSLLALTILFPGLDPTSILSLLGVGSIALGFAFKDIFQNLAAGVILLIREPYRKGDEICVGDYEGVVEEVEARATHIRTIDQRMVIIPNVRIFTEPITVNTERESRTTSFTLAIAYGGDPRNAMEVVREAILSVDEVVDDPAPQVGISALNDYSIDLIVLYSAGSRLPEQMRVKAAVLLAIHDACKANGIALPYPTHVNLVQPYDPAATGPDKLDGMNEPEP